MKSATVASLARSAGIDVDEALVTLWEAGLEYLSRPGEFVPKRDMHTAKHALGLASPKEQFTVEYWMGITGMTRDELAAELRAVGVVLPPNVRKIPKNSLRRLRSLISEKPVSAPVAAATRRPPLLPPLRWESVGATPLRRYLAAEEVLSIHSALEQDFAIGPDPISPPGIRDDSLLESAVARPGMLPDKYPTCEMAAAALFHSLVLNHAFHNGNKRTALVALLAFLDIHDLVLTRTEDELFRFTIKAAAHGLVPAGADEVADREVLCIAEWIRAGTRRVERGERPMKWWRLRQRLREFGCDSTPAGGVGNRLNITRQVASAQKRRWGFAKPATPLFTQVAWAGDGTEADRDTIHKIRRDLCLDDEHDIDSATFYRDAVIDSFIIDYRRILRRLAKL